jgi:hypothetical protein
LALTAALAGCPGPFSELPATFTWNAVKGSVTPAGTLALSIDHRGIAESTTAIYLQVSRAGQTLVERTLPWQLGLDIQTELVANGTSILATDQLTMEVANNWGRWTSRMSEKVSDLGTP